jgi:hypothetical protein
MKTFSKDAFIRLVIDSNSDFVVAKGETSQSFTVRLNATESQTEIGFDNSKVFTQHWELSNFEKTNEGDFFVFKMWGYPPLPLNNFVDTLRFEGKQMKIPAEGILYVIENFKKQGLPDYQNENLKKIDVLGEYLFSQEKSFGSDILNIAKEKEGKNAVLVLEFNEKPELPTSLFFDNFQNFQRGGKIVLVKLFSGAMTATRQKISMDNDSTIHPVPEESEKDYTVDLLFEDNELTAYYYDKSSERVHKLQPVAFGVM